MRGPGSMMSTFFAVVLFVVYLAGKWKVFEKAGIAGWKSIVPLYSDYCIAAVLFGNGLIFLLELIPVANFIYTVVLSYKLSKCFGHGIGMAILLLVLPMVGYCAIGFSEDSFFWE